VTRIVTATVVAEMVVNAMNKRKKRKIFLSREMILFVFVIRRRTWKSPQTATARFTNPPKRNEPKLQTAHSREPFFLPREILSAVADEPAFGRISPE